MYYFRPAFLLLLLYGCVWHPLLNRYDDDENYQLGWVYKHLPRIKFRIGGVGFLKATSYWCPTDDFRVLLVVLFCDLRGTRSIKMCFLSVLYFVRWRSWKHHSAHRLAEEQWYSHIRQLHGGMYFGVPVASITGMMVLVVYLMLLRLS